LPLGLIIGENHDGAARLFAAIAGEILRGIPKASPNVGSTVEILAAKKILKLAMHFFPAALQWKPHTRHRVEHHDADTIAFRKLAQRIVCGVSQPLHVRAHATADVQQQHDIDGHVLTGEITNLNPLALLPQFKVLNAETSDGSAVAIEYLNIDADQGHVAAEYDFFVRGLQCRKYEAEQKTERESHVKSYPTW